MSVHIPPQDPQEGPSKEPALYIYLYAKNIAPFSHECPVCHAPVLEEMSFILEETDDFFFIANCCEAHGQALIAPRLGKSAWN